MRCDAMRCRPAKGPRLSPDLPNAAAEAADAISGLVSQGHLELALLSVSFLLGAGPREATDRLLVLVSVRVGRLVLKAGLELATRWRFSRIGLSRFSTTAIVQQSFFFCLQLFGGDTGSIEGNRVHLSRQQKYELYLGGL